nr:type IV pilin protein [Halomonas socia]
MSHAKDKGFTLIELMIVVAIIAILASVAYPSYQRYVTATWRTAATACLSELSQAMARRYTVDMSYAGDELPANGCVAQIEAEGRYIFEAQVDDQSFVISASPQGVQAARDQQCGVLAIDHRGARTASGEASGCY